VKSIEVGAKNSLLAKEESLPESAPDVSVALCPIGNTGTGASFRSRGAARSV